MQPMSQIPPNALVLEMILGRMISHAIGVAATLKLADLLATGPKSCSDLAKETNTHAPSIERLLRAQAREALQDHEVALLVLETSIEGAFRGTCPGADLRDRQRVEGTHPKQAEA